MSDAIFVLNAGSSSLKFSVYGLAQDLNLVAHGEIEGLGASAHFKAKDERGRTLADVSLGNPTRSVGHVRQGEACCRRIMELYGRPNLTTDQIRAVAEGHDLDGMDPLKEFSTACRKELSARHW